MNNTTLHLISQTRSRIREQRQQLSHEQQRQAALKARTILSKTKWFSSAKKIAFYWPSDGELSPSPTLKYALSLGKHCYLPVVDPATKRMQFRQYQQGDKLRRNCYGIAEPLPKSKLALAKELDLILVPLVAFDKEGKRLGMGGGYYDRYLAKTRIQQRIIGLAHSLQEVNQLESRNWDIPIHAVVTETEIQYFSVKLSRQTLNNQRD